MSTLNLTFIIRDASEMFLIASLMASFNMGVYYILAVFSDFKPFYRWTVPFLGLTGAIAIDVALCSESRNNH